MPEEVYKKVADALAARGGAVPVLKSKEFDALLRELFEAEEAELAAQMPPKPLPAEEFARSLGEDPVRVKSILEALADKGIVFTRDQGGVRVYSLMPLLPGIFELQFTTGVVNDRTRRLARLFDDYFRLFNDQVMKPLEKYRGKIAVFPFSRVIPVERELPGPETTVHPYSRVSEFIQKADPIAVSTCYCRHHGELIGDPCGRPKEVCMSFGPQAKFIIERGFGRELNKEQALKVLDIAEEAALVHCSSNTGDYITFMCNCCDCHCGIIKSIKSGIMPMGASSDYIAKLDEEKCLGCGTCEERCQVEAITLGPEGLAVLDQDRCIGCGLCLTACPDEALTLVLREKTSAPPAGTRELNQAMRSSVSK
ncbi:MAG: 4Fe-4S binding protein [Deltaproteobacteria bacterium]|nr:4Fe-4S binding protein [Deltaproteobacteria bacterium]